MWHHPIYRDRPEIWLGVTLERFVVVTQHSLYIESMISFSTLALHSTILCDHQRILFSKVSEIDLCSFYNPCCLVAHTILLLLQW